MIKILFVAFLLPLSSQAIVHVGNAGGEAEMTVLKMVPNLKAWAKACNQNPGVCGDVGLFSAEDFIALGRPVTFASVSASIQQCSGTHVILTHEALYVNDVQPKAVAGLAQALIEQMLACSGWDRRRLSQLKFEMLPLARELRPVSLKVLQGHSTDYVIAETSKNAAQAALTKAMSCQRYRYLSSENGYLKIRCLENNQNFLVQARSINQDIEFVSRFDGDSTY